MRRIMASVLVAVLCVGPAETFAAQKAAGVAEEAAALATLAAAIPLGSRIKVQTSDGRRLKGTLMSVSADGIIVKRETRMPEPALSIPFPTLAKLQLDRSDSGISVGKAIGIGLSAGVGAILTMFAIALQLDD
jgi:hypothetical protein